VPRLWIQPGTRHRTPQRELLVCMEHDRQASSFILSEGTPGHTAFYCYNCLVDQASLDLRREEAHDSLTSPSPSSCSPSDLLQVTKFKPSKSFHSDARSLSVGSGQTLFLLCPSKCDILWQMTRLGTELDIAELGLWLFKNWNPWHILSKTAPKQPKYVDYSCLIVIVFLILWSTDLGKDFFF
jgi:hypothetical protein